MISQSSDIKKYLAMKGSDENLIARNKGLPKIRLGIISDHATQQITKVLKSALYEKGFNADIYESDYGTASIDTLDSSSDLHKFSPEFVIYSICVQKYRDRFLNTETPLERDNLPEMYLEECLLIIEALISKGITVIINNFALPVERQFGNYGLITNQSLYGSVLKFNSLLASATQKHQGCIINDVMYTANRIGSDRFFDERLWLSGKYPCAIGAIPSLCYSITDSISIRKGKLTKVLILDLDNTLWGGVIGDDGINGIKLGGSPEGDAYISFQKYIKSLKQRGYVLAVCSKNNETTALEPFKEHPEMILREKDIAVFVANWNDKPSNIEYISRVLNLGLDSFIFIDDMPFERELVRTKLPKVIVPELPEDPADYIFAIENSRALEALGFAEEDFQRNQSYREEALRTKEQLVHGNIDDYLSSLQMKSECSMFKNQDIPRIAQLIQRSNQFNLRTSRISELQCNEYLKNDGSKFGVQVRLADKFGDYGLIAVICCDIISNYIFITELVMSCRVLKRGVERLIMNFIFQECYKRGLLGVKGEYIPTAKNSMVENFYAQFNFVKEQNETQIWVLTSADYSYIPTLITEYQKDKL